jgi:hypothetical protein
MISIAQYSAMRCIIRELQGRTKEHPSESTRESFSSYTQEQINDTWKYLEHILEEEDGRKAYLAIGAYHRCLASVVGAHVNGEI